MVPLEPISTGAAVKGTGGGPIVTNGCMYRDPLDAGVDDEAEVAEDVDGDDDVVAEASLLTKGVTGLANATGITCV